MKIQPSDILSGFMACYRELLHRAASPFIIRRLIRDLTKQKKQDELALNGRIDQLSWCRGLQYACREGDKINFSLDPDAGPFYFLDLSQIEDLIKTFREDRQFFVNFDALSPYRIELPPMARQRLEDEGFLDANWRKVSFSRVINAYTSLIDQFEYGRLMLRPAIRPRPRLVIANDLPPSRAPVSHSQPGFLKSIP
jgi:hypothetical protein